MVMLTRCDSSSDGDEFTDRAPEPVAGIESSPPRGTDTLPPSSPPGRQPSQSSKTIKFYTRRSKSAKSGHPGAERRETAQAECSKSNAAAKRKRSPSIGSSSSGDSSSSSSDLSYHSDDESTDYYFSDVCNRRCQLFTQLVKDLSPLQEADVREIGFGGLLHFRTVSASVYTINNWLVDYFDPVTKYFHSDGQIRFSLTAKDARKVFGLNVNPEKAVVEDARTPEVRNMKDEWRQVHGLPVAPTMPAVDVNSMIRKLRQGGDDFKRFFVLYAMHMVLTPTAGTDIDLGLLNCLWDVDSIKSYNWAGYVVDHLCLELRRYVDREGSKRSPLSKGSQGCMLLLLITYFHYTIWPEHPLSDDEPYIKQWGGDSSMLRVMQEMQAKGFGQLLFKNPGAPCNCSRARSDALLGPAVEGVSGSSNQRAEIALPTAEDVEASLSEGLKKKTWQILNDIDHRLKDYASSLDIPTRPLKESCFRPKSDGTLKFDVGYAYDIMVSNLYEVCDTLSPEIGRARPSPLDAAIHGGPNPIIEPIDEDFPHQQMMNSPWRTWTFPYPPNYSSFTVKKLCMQSHNFEQHRLEIADYCLQSHPNSGEVLFATKGGDVMPGVSLARGKLLSIDRLRTVDIDVVNVLSMLLNSYWDRKMWTSRVCMLGVKMDESSFNPAVVVDRWLLWLEACELDLSVAAFVFVPMIYKNEYSLVVINFMDKRIQAIQLKQPEAGDPELENLGRLIGTTFWQLLEAKKYHDVLDKYRAFNYEVLTPKWRDALMYADRGLSVMCMLEHFNGSQALLDRLRLDVEKKRVQLRISYLCFIVMAEENTNRQAVYDRIPHFLASKGALPE